MWGSLGDRVSVAVSSSILGLFMTAAAVAYLQIDVSAVILWLVYNVFAVPGSVSSKVLEELVKPAKRL